MPAEKPDAVSKIGPYLNSEYGTPVLPGVTTAASMDAIPTKSVNPTWAKELQLVTVVAACAIGCAMCLNFPKNVALRRYGACRKVMSSS